MDLLPHDTISEPLYIHCDNRILISLGALAVPVQAVASVCGLHIDVVVVGF